MKDMKKILNVLLIMLLIFTGMNTVSATDEVVAVEQDIIVQVDKTYDQENNTVKAVIQLTSEEGIEISEVKSGETTYETPYEFSYTENGTYQYDIHYIKNEEQQTQSFLVEVTEIEEKDEVGTLDLPVTLSSTSAGTEGVVVSIEQSATIIDLQSSTPAVDVTITIMTDPASKLEEGKLVIDLSSTNLLFVDGTYETSGSLYKKVTYSNVDKTLTIEYVNGLNGKFDYSFRVTPSVVAEPGDSYVIDVELTGKRMQVQNIHQYLWSQKRLK